MVPNPHLQYPMRAKHLPDPWGQEKQLERAIQWPEENRNTWISLLLLLDVPHGPGKTAHCFSFASQLRIAAYVPDDRKVLARSQPPFSQRQAACGLIDLEQAYCQTTGPVAR